MCGFAGLLPFRQTHPDVLSDSTRKMTDALEHRGPDDSGIWADPDGRCVLGFRRLAILDLSPAGHQPMASRSGRYILAFNGEIFNFQSLREGFLAEGVSFRSGSDTEVILAAVEKWGLEQALAKMIGMFAIALWDRERQELQLARDRLGIKPLYIARTREGTAFGSELGALTLAPGFDRRLDPDAALSYLRYLFVPAPGTPFAGVRKLTPGHLMRIPANFAGEVLPESTPFWSVEQARAAGLETVASAPPILDGRYARRKTDELEALLSDAVRLRMIADVPIGALLSGGIDSSVVVALMQAEATQPVRTFTIGFDHREHDESDHARAVAGHLGTNHTELRVTGRDALDLVPELPRIFDEPLADPSQIPTFLVSRLARQQVTVALSGDGGDELFAGYTRHTTGMGLIPRLAKIPRVPRRWMGGVLGALPPQAWERAHALLPGTGGMRLVAQKANKLARMMRVDSAREMYRTLMSTDDAPGRFLPLASGGWDPLRAGLEEWGSTATLADMLESDQRYYLPDDLLQKVDRASMAVSLEVRVPILDHRVVEFSWTLPDHLKVREDRNKWILREVLYRHVPRHLVDRPKMGFSVPIAEWMRGPLREWARAHLLDAPAGGSLFDRTAVGVAWREFESGRSERALLLWATAIFEAWRREWKIADVSAL